MRATDGSRPVIAPATHAALDFWRRQTVVEIAFVFTLFLVILHGFRQWPFQYVGGTIAVAGLLYGPIRRAKSTWLALAVIGTVVLAHNWHPVDNHKFLLVYWLWVLFLSTLAPTEKAAEGIVQFNARFFLAFVFLAASAQKLASSSYVDGSFFELTVLTDPRFEGFMKLFGFPADIFSLSDHLHGLVRSPLHSIENHTVLLPTDPGIALAGTLITWWDVLVQIAIGAMVATTNRKIEIAGHVLLLVFIYTTYFAAPVIGFGWTLSILALVLVHGRYPRLSLWYLLSFPVLELYQVPWQQYVPDF